MMKNVQKCIGRSLSLALALALCANIVVAQTTASLRGDITDGFGGAIGGATVTLINAQNVEKTVTTNDRGAFVFNDLAAGKYFLRVIANGFALYEQEAVDVAVTRRDALKIKLAAGLESRDGRNLEIALSTDPDANTGAIVMKGRPRACREDPDDLASSAIWRIRQPNGVLVRR
jgi:hypothetical protein